MPGMAIPALLLLPHSLITQHTVVVPVIHSRGMAGHQPHDAPTFFLHLLLGRHVSPAAQRGLIWTFESQPERTMQA